MAEEPGAGWAGDPGRGAAAPRGGKAKMPEPEKLTPFTALRLLSICDSESGVVLFDRIWNWPADADATGVGNLVRSFFMIAKQLDHGMISRVIFETPPLTDTFATMEMLCTKNERVVVAVFHETLDFDEEDEEIHTAMRQLVEQTRELWTPEVDRTAFTETVDNLCARIMGAPPTPTASPRKLDEPRRPNSV